MLAVVFEATFRLGSLEGQPKGLYAFEVQANKLSASACTMWVASAVAYEPLREWGMGFEMPDLRSSMDVLRLRFGVTPLGVVAPAPILPMINLNDNSLLVPTRPSRTSNTAVPEYDH